MKEINIAIFIVRLLTLIPFIFYLVEQSRIKERNGIVKKTRYMTIRFMAAITLMTLNLLASRIQIFMGRNPLDMPNTIIQLIVAFLVLLATLDGIRVFAEIRKYQDKEQN